MLSTNPSPVNPALEGVLQLANKINPVTPEGRPTVAQSLIDRATSMMAPPMQPSVQDIAQDAGMGSQIQMMQQQQQEQQMQQAMQQLMQQQGSQDNAMRFGVAAAPGAQSIGMAEGGIVGYSTAGLTSDELARLLNTPPSQLSPDDLAKRLEILKSGQYTAPGEVPRSVGAPASKGIGAMMRGAASKFAPLALLSELFYTSPEDIAILEAAERKRQAPAGAPVQPPIPQPQTPVGQTTQVVPPVQPDAARAAQARQQPPQQPPQQRPPMMPPGARVGIDTLMGPAAPSAGQRYMQEAKKVLGEYEVGTPSPVGVAGAAQAREEAFAPFMRAMGIDPEQFKKDIKQSEERKERKLAGLGALEQQYKESRTGINGLINLLSAAGGRTDPLTAVGQQYGLNQARDLAQNEQFMLARNAYMDAADIEQAAIRDKRRAEVTGKLDKAEAAETAAQAARNKKRDALVTITTETAKMEQQTQEKALDRASHEAIAQLQTSVQREIAQAQREGNLEARRGNILASIAKTEETALAKASENFQKRVNALGMLPGAKPTPEQAKEVEAAYAEFEAAKAAVRSRIAETRAEVMSAKSGDDFKVERIK
jgi:hypothetical protein